MKNKKCSSCYYLHVQELFLKSKLDDQKGAKIHDVFGLSPNHLSSTNSGNKYYISMNFKTLQTPSNSRDLMEIFKLWHDIKYI